MTVYDVKTAKEKAEKAFDTIAKRDYVDGRWGYYRAMECDQPVKPDLQRAFDEYRQIIDLSYDLTQIINNQ
jgi:hypothetical protein